MVAAMVRSTLLEQRSTWSVEFSTNLSERWAPKYDRLQNDESRRKPRRWQSEEKEHSTVVRLRRCGRSRMVVGAFPMRYVHVAPKAVLSFRSKSSAGVCSASVTETAVPGPVSTTFSLHGTAR